jgi:AhpC/TSA family
VSESGPRPGPPRPPAGISRYGWFVGLIGLLLVAYITFNTIRTKGIGAGVNEGQQLPPFAVPLLKSDLDGDANLARKPGSGAGSSGDVTACEVRDPRALNFCRVAAGHPVVLAFVSDRQSASLRELDAMQRVAPDFPETRFVAVFLRGDRDKARKAAAEHGWRFPLGWDRHADVAAIYGVKALPALVFGDARRRERSAAYRYLGPDELAARIRRLGPA